jgi:hypothetical protein
MFWSCWEDVEEGAGLTAPFSRGSVRLRITGSAETEPRLEGAVDLIFSATSFAPFAII